MVKGCQRFFKSFFSGMSCHFVERPKTSRKASGRRSGNEGIFPAVDPLDALKTRVEDLV